MNRRKLIIAMAVLLSLVGMIAVYGYVNGADKRALSKTGAAPVVIVDKRIAANTSWGDILKGTYVHEDKVPVDSVPADAIPDLKVTISTQALAQTDIAPGTIVLRQMFGEKTAVTGVLAIPKGKIAVAVGMSSKADVAGFVQPQSEVAIFVTFKIKTDTPNGNLGGEDVFATKLLLPRIQVLATSDAPPEDVQGSKASKATTDMLVTLALTQAEAEKVILAQQVGQLYLGLLSDSSVTAPSGGSVSTVQFKPTPIFMS